MGEFEDLFPHPLPLGIPSVKQGIIYDFVRGALQRRALVPTLIHLFSNPVPRRTGMDPVEYEYFLRIVLDSVVGLSAESSSLKLTGYGFNGRSKTVMGAVDDVLAQIDKAQGEHDDS